MKIGLFDSGIGGWSFLHKVEKAFPFHQYKYFADQKNCPYGNKTYNELEKIAEQWISTFKDEELDILIIACNTMTVMFKEKIQSSLQIPVIGTTDGLNEKFFQEKRVVLLATQKTIESEWYPRNLPSVDLISVGNSWLANTIEEKPALSDLEKLVLEREVRRVAGDNWDQMILGCTHYPLVREQLQGIWEDKTFFDPADKIVEVLVPYVNSEGKGRGKIQMFTTGNEEMFRGQIASFFDEHTLDRIECNVLRVAVM